MKVDSSAACQQALPGAVGLRRRQPLVSKVSPRPLPTLSSTQASQAGRTGPAATKPVQSPRPATMTARWKYARGGIRLRLRTNMNSPTKLFTTHPERAAIDLLGTEGLRGLTHARVDDRADLPKGSTSNYFRSRAALLDGVVDAMVRQETTEVAATLKPATPDDLVDELCRLYEYMTGPNVVATRARMALWTEATTNPWVRQALLRARGEAIDPRPMVEIIVRGALARGTGAGT
ncbi:TetR/AcrR family transcriptional regulator [Lentzea sp. HUAS12]|uniref:TetR/AcrR family transcriptional regulator n=1 Tax=Lentzea sp. HUAS12 TaxID=2951806 RepID=UPI0020A1ADDF|nr:hypothetical protein [Lentzea sp. HUAS12]USX55185.1 hypothetical protein ND450_14115 [Lentzea sp. HUAS12]